MKYTLLQNFTPFVEAEGFPSSDATGNFIIFPLEMKGIFTAGEFFKDESRATHLLTQDDYVEIEGKRYLKVYY